MAQSSDILGGRRRGFRLSVARRAARERLGRVNERVCARKAARAESEARAGHVFHPKRNASPLQTAENIKTMIRQ
jgi:hypothetical protein